MIIFSRLVQSLSRLQITEVLTFVGEEGRRVIAAQARQLAEDRMHVVNDAAPKENVELGLPTQTVRHIGSPRSVTELDLGLLERLGQRHQAVIAVASAVGDTVIEGDALLRVHGATQPLPDAELISAVHLGRERTFAQDPKYALRLLVDVAIKALSPAINDPTTAVQAIDQISDLMRRLESHKLGTLHILDRDGSLRVIVPMPSWGDYLTLGFDEIRQYGSGSIQVMRRLRAALSGLHEACAVDDQRDTLKRYLAHLDSTITHSGLDPQDRATARQADPQGLGLSRAPATSSPAAEI
jgi:uncharacterized membrane protein